MLLLRRRLCRLHLVEPFPSVQGILVNSFDGHYRLKRPEVLESPERTQELDGELFVPRERVIFVQRIG